MTTQAASTVPATRAEDANPQPLPWRRMTWVTWRQHRSALVGAAVLLGALAVGLSILGLQLHGAYTAAVVCHPAASFTCSYLANNFDDTAAFLANGLVLQAVPALIGAFVGAPLLTRELETGTFRYAWTQGLGRWRWALAKLVSLGVVVAVAAGALSVLISWYYGPYFATRNVTLGLSEWSPLAPNLFGLRGIAFAAWTLCAFAIGALAGVAIRRVIPAILATMATYAGLAFVTELFLRQRYLSALVTSGLNVPGSAWVISQLWFADGGGQVSQSVLGQVLEKGGPQLAGKGGVPRSLSSWQYLVQHGYTQWTTYQPAGRFWPFQWIEGGWLLALSALLIAATVWLVQRHRG